MAHNTMLPGIILSYDFILFTSLLRIMRPLDTTKYKNLKRTISAKFWKFQTVIYLFEAPDLVSQFLMPQIQVSASLSLSANVSKMNNRGL